MSDFMSLSVVGPIVGGLLLVALLALYSHGSPQVRRAVGWILGALGVALSGALATLAVLRGRGDPSVAREDAKRREQNAMREAKTKRDARVREADEKREAALVQDTDAWLAEREQQWKEQGR